MGYDRAITMFSPDGRLLQVEYAKKTVKQGSTAIGIVCKDGVLLCTDKRIVDPLIVPESVEKIFQIDQHIGATASGILSDARVLIERAQLKSQQYKVTFDSPIDTLSVVKDMCNLMQICTQSGGLRPFGVSVLIAGVDNKVPILFETDPTGIYFQYKAVCIGEGENEVEEIFQKEYRDDMTLDDGLKLAIKALAKVGDEKFNINRLDCIIIRTDDATYRKADKEKLKSVLDSVKKK
jgi:proteasome alpha subunit